MMAEFSILSDRRSLVLVRRSLIFGPSTSTLHIKSLETLEEVIRCLLLLQGWFLKLFSVNSLAKPPIYLFPWTVVTGRGLTRGIVLLNIDRFIDFLLLVE